MIDIEALHADVFNPNESDLEYFLRRGRELGVIKEKVPIVPEPKKGDDGEAR